MAEDVRGDDACVDGDKGDDVLFLTGEKDAMEESSVRRGETPEGDSSVPDDNFMDPREDLETDADGDDRDPLEEVLEGNGLAIIVVVVVIVCITFDGSRVRSNDLESVDEGARWSIIGAVS